MFTIEIEDGREAPLNPGYHKYQYHSKIHMKETHLFKPNIFTGFVTLSLNDIENFVGLEIFDSLT